MFYYVDIFITWFNMSDAVYIKLHHFRFHSNRQYLAGKLLDQAKDSFSKHLNKKKSDETNQEFTHQKQQHYKKT